MTRMRHRLATSALLLLLGLAIAACGSSAPPEAAPPAAAGGSLPGGLVLPAGYTHRPLQGIDTAVGEILKDGRIVLRYDVGPLAGLHTVPEDRESCSVYEERPVHGETMRYCGTEAAGFKATFVESSGNFWGFPKDDAERDELLAILATYGPPAEARH